MEIEHKKSTNFSLVGLQVWRGAFLLADFIIHNRWHFCTQKALEVAAGVGLTSIVAAQYCREVVCTGKFEIQGLNWHFTGAFSTFFRH